MMVSQGNRWLRRRSAAARRARAVRSRFVPRCILTLLALAALTTSTFNVRPLQAQSLEGRAVPRQSYFLAFQPFRRGDYREALRGFRSAANSGINTGQGRWVDSICYFTMIGECFYHMGDYGSALDQYEAALNLTIARHGWLKRVQLQPAIAPVVNVPAIPWGPSGRNARPGGFQDTMLSLQGTDPEVALRQGGIVAPPELYPVRVMEIMRCVGVALKRRAEILGPLAPQSPLTGQLVKEFSRSQTPPGHWMQAIVDVQLGLAKVAAGDTQEGAALLQRSASINGAVDHPLTALALNVLGHLAVESGELEAAQRYFFEASFPAVYFELTTDLEEALVNAARVHNLRGQAGVFPALATAADWSLANDLDRASAAFYLAAGENAATSRMGSQAAALLAQSRRAMGRSDLPASDLGAAWAYLSALVAYQTESTATGDKLLAEAMRLLSNHSPHLFQLDRTAKLYRTKEITERVAGLLLENLLREPTAVDWKMRPAQTLLVQYSPLEAPLQLWMEISLARREFETMVLASDMLRRHKFYRQLKLAGRLLALRWVVDAPEVALTAETRQQRQQLFALNPELQNRAQRMSEATAALAELPLLPDDPEQQKTYQQLTKELMELAEQQEVALHQLVLAPVAVERVFPPLRTLDQIQTQLRPGQAILAFAETGRQLHGMMLTNQKQYRHWQAGVPATVRRDVAKLLREIGNFDRNQVLPADRLTSDAWKQMADQIVQVVARELNDGALEGIEELVIVPDGPLWYLPFEMLPVNVNGEQQLLIDRVRIRYAPTIGLALPDGRPSEAAGERVIVHGRLFSKDNQDLVAEAAEQLREQHPRATILRKRLPVTSQYLAPAWQQLIVLDDIELNDREPLGWSPAQVDQGKPGGSLSDWQQLPFGAPDLVILPGYRTAAEEGLKGRSNGDELLVATCGLMAAGTRTVVLARWRTGGLSSMEVLREFLNGLPQDPPAAAWQRSLLLVRSSELDPVNEPRLKDVAADTAPTAEHPFFWAGYLMMGTR